MRLYFLRDVRAEYAPKKVFKEGCVYDIPLNNLATMLDNKFAVPESEAPTSEIAINKPQAAKPQAVNKPVKRTRRRRTNKK